MIFHVPPPKSNESEDDDSVRFLVAIIFVMLVSFNHVIFSKSTARGPE